MRSRAFLRIVTADHVDLLDQFLAILRRESVRFCVIGGQAVNAYVEPVVSLDLDVAVAAIDLRKLLAALPETLTVETFPHSINISQSGSDLRIQLQTDPRYDAFVAGASTRSVLGLNLPVAMVEDVLRGKVWAAEDATRRGSKRQKDLADIARILESFPHLRGQVPPAILDRLL
ncbi:MAG: hypothetical protein K2Y23_10590 [Cyanobacteria bacterium]|nr:hypothetical protein [Cyanobacteriota bacterium]